MPHNKSSLGRLVAPKDMQFTKHMRNRTKSREGGTLPATYGRIFHLDDDIARSLELRTRPGFKFGLEGSVEDDCLHFVHVYSDYCTERIVSLNKVYPEG